MQHTACGCMHAHAQVYRSEGLSGFWRGNMLNVLRTAPFKVRAGCARARARAAAGATACAWQAWHPSSHASMTHAMSSWAARGLGSYLLYFFLDSNKKNKILSHHPRREGEGITALGVAVMRCAAVTV